MAERLFEENRQIEILVDGFFLDTQSCLTALAYVVSGFCEADLKTMAKITGLGVGLVRKDLEIVGMVGKKVRSPQELKLELWESFGRKKEGEKSPEEKFAEFAAEEWWKINRGRGN